MLNNNSYQHSIYKKAFISHKIVDRSLYKKHKNKNYDTK